jgi:hypothetical protein
MLKTKLLVLFFSILLLNACNSTPDKETKSSSKETSVTTLYPWLEGDWKGELFFHAEDKNISASLSYHNGELNVSFPNLCEGEGGFASDKATGTIFVAVQNKTFQLNPMKDDEIIYENVEGLTDIKVIYIQYYEESKLAGWLEKK